MRVSVSEAKAQLTELVRRAENGEDIVLTRHNREVVHLTPVQAPVNEQQKRRVIDEARKSAAATLVDGPGAARSQDFLYDEDGLPG